MGSGHRAAAPLEAAARPPDVVNQVQLGPLEATTLAGGDLTGLQKWLADNGYSIRTAVLDALGPVKMTFAATQLVYPMRLSAVATSPQQVTVFTLSDHRQRRTDADAATQSTEVQYAGTVANAVHDPLLSELAANHGSYLTRLQVDISQPARISSDFTFGNAPNDDAYRRVVFVDHNVAIPLEPILAAGFLVAVIAVAVLVFRRRRRA